MKRRRTPCKSKSSLYRSLRSSVANDLKDLDDDTDPIGYEGGSSSDEDEVKTSFVAIQPEADSSSIHDIQDYVNAVNVTAGGATDDVVVLRESSSECSWLSDTCSESSSISSARASSQITAEDEDDLRSQLRKWAVSFNVPNSTTSSLLKILHPHLPMLPKDSRTLLGFKPVAGIQVMGKGEYYYFGLEATLKRVLEFNPSLSPLLLSFNIDGIPIYKSSGTECWPIMCLVNNSNLPPFVIAAWCGKGKPPLCDYFKDFVPELKDLMSSGMQLRDKHYSVICKCFVCDAPAKAFAKGVAGHGGYYGCNYCIQKGVWAGRVTFPNSKATLRTDESFRLMSQPEHHLRQSPLLDLNIDMVSCFPSDYLHLICLGVGKRLLSWLMTGKRRVRQKQISDDDQARVNSRLAVSRRFWPRDFSRTPRGLDEVKRWKATEFRQFILYLSLVVLQGSVLSKDYYKLLVYLHVGVTILCREDLHQDLRSEAIEALKLFVHHSGGLFGRAFVSYNVHNLIHIGSDCERYGKLDNFSAFPFENELHVLKRTVRGNSKPLHQLVARILEREREFSLQPRAKLYPDGILLFSLRKNGKPTLHHSGQSFSKASWKGRIISLLPGDNVVTLNDGNVVFVYNFMITSQGPVLIGKRFLSYSNLYDSPIASSDIGIYVAKKLSDKPNSWALCCIESKAVAVPIRDTCNYAIFPLVN